MQNSSPIIKTYICQCPNNSHQRNILPHNTHRPKQIGKQQILVHPLKYTFNERIPCQFVNEDKDEGRQTQLSFTIGLTNIIYFKFQLHYYGLQYNKCT